MIVFQVSRVDERPGSTGVSVYTHTLLDESHTGAVPQQGRSIRRTILIDVTRPGGAGEAFAERTSQM